SRIRPALDDKILPAWNALMIRGLAVAGRVLGRPDLLDAADTAVDFLRERMTVQGRLRASFRDGQARLDGYLDDHAFLLDALLELLQSRWQERHLDYAVALADTLLEHFEDSEGGGFWFTAHDHEELLHRTKPLADESLPS